MESAQTLFADLSAHIRSLNAGNFEPLAFRVFAHQYSNNKPYRLFCDGRKKTPDTVTCWQDIPPAPAAAFKRFALTCADAELCVPEHGGRTFHSSGTTGSETSKHYMDWQAVSLYGESCMTSYWHFVDFPPDQSKLPILPLTPTAFEAPHSSLSFMVEYLGDTQGEVAARDWNEEWLERAMVRLPLLDKPAVLFGTAFAWVLILDRLAEHGETLTLPAGTRVIETGGFKGRSREVERGELYRMFTERLGVPATHCLAEYGMSEMASQFYDTTYRDHVLGIAREPRKMGLPHLVRTRVIDPITGEESERGQHGVLAHYDIANLNSCLAIQTEDWGYAHPDGDGFVLLGRAPGAALRGCSLTAEEFAARQSAR
ncbi:MAG: hypothetical protein H7145_01145 [Akkermansiaceae bacterium]|nr:hypothetical protein [Armatimonadota bacterium]